MVEIEWNGLPTAAAFTRKLDTPIQLGRKLFRNRHQMSISSYIRLIGALEFHKAGGIFAVTRYIIDESTGGG